LSHLVVNTVTIGIDDDPRRTARMVLPTAPRLPAERPVNVLDPQFYVDPWDDYRWLRDEAPAYWDPKQRLWAVSRYQDVLDIERTAGRYSSYQGTRPHMDQSADESMINMDDPEHYTQRRLVVPRFTPRSIRGHEEQVRSVTAGILDAVTPLGECEAIEAIASRLPAIMISDLLGYPRELWDRVRFWAEQLMLLGAQTSPDGPPHVTHPGIPPVIREFSEITVGLIKARRDEPRDDLISLWANTPGWSTKHVLDETLLVLDGGAETTRTVIGSMIRELALRPDQRRLLLDRPELLPDAVEEFIRWVSPISNMRRTVTEDHELHGQHLAAGDELLLLYAAANRDPRAFDRPDELDVTRYPVRHLAFGHGTHLCLGTHLARLEIRVCFEELLRRMPDWELADPDEPRILPATFARAYDRIRITFTPSQSLGRPRSPRSSSSSAGTGSTGSTAVPAPYFSPAPHTNGVAMAPQQSLDLGGPAAALADLPDPLQAFRLIDARRDTCVRRDQLLALRKRLAGELLGEPGLVAATLTADFQLTLHGPDHTMALDRAAIVASAARPGRVLTWLELAELAVDYRAGDYGTRDLGAGDHGLIAGHGVMRTAFGTSLTTAPISFFIRLDGALMTAETVFLGVSSETALADGAVLPAREQLRAFLDSRESYYESYQEAPAYAGAPAYPEASSYPEEQWS
jgi:cytochrome P450 family 142 subfamily A polypeptide 1